MKTFQKYLGILAVLPSREGKTVLEILSTYFKNYEKEFCSRNMLYRKVNRMKIRNNQIIMSLTWTVSKRKLNYFYII